MLSLTYKADQPNPIQRRLKVSSTQLLYQVLGHVKTCLVGILIAIFGMGLYSYYSVVESRKKTEDASSLPVAAQVIIN